MALSDILTEAARQRFVLTDVTPPDKAKLCYPRWLPMMRFAIRQYRAEGFGNLMTMDTVAMGGLMRLSTIVLTPGEGAGVPFLLVDTMRMKKKALAYVEFYDCTARGEAQEALSALPKRYAALPDYAEKPAWYVTRRTADSLIKGGEGADAAALDAMVTDCVNVYLDAAKAADKDAANSAGLSAFREEMCQKGSPATPTLQKLFGREGADRFFRDVIMPIPQMEKER